VESRESARNWTPKSVEFALAVAIRPLFAARPPLLAIFIDKHQFSAVESMILGLRLEGNYIVGLAATECPKESRSV
jgi:hypothetical protein